MLLTIIVNNCLFSFDGNNDCVIHMVIHLSRFRCGFRFVHNFRDDNSRSFCRNIFSLRSFSLNNRIQNRHLRCDFSGRFFCRFLGCSFFLRFFSNGLFNRFFNNRFFHRFFDNGFFHRFFNNRFFHRFFDNGLFYRFLNNRLFNRFFNNGFFNRFFDNGLFYRFFNNGLFYRFLNNRLFNRFFDNRFFHRFFNNRFIKLRIQYLVPCLILVDFNPAVFHTDFYINEFFSVVIEIIFIYTHRDRTIGRIGTPNNSLKAILQGKMKI